MVNESDKVLIFLIVSRDQAFFFSNRADRDDAFEKCRAFGAMAMNALCVDVGDAESGGGGALQKHLEATSTPARAAATLEPLMQMLGAAAAFLGEQPVILFMSFRHALNPYLAYPSEAAASAALEKCRVACPHVDSRIFPADPSDLRKAHIMAGAYGETYLNSSIYHLASQNKFAPVATSAV